MLTLLLITNDPQVAAYTTAHGVGRIMVDTERLGKAERQAGRDTLISTHEITDVGVIRRALPDAEIMLRVNPVHAHTADEIAAGAAQGADLIMVPMVATVRDVEIAARACAAAGNGPSGKPLGLVPLIETPAALVRLNRIVEIPGVREVYIGLNDLHQAMGLDFLFELVAGGLIDQAADTCRRAGMPFGFGGIAGVSGGHVPGELVLAEHVRLGSTRVILSRAFSQRANTLAEFQTKLDFPGEVRRLRAAETAAQAMSPADLEARHLDLRQRVAGVVDGIQAKKAAS